jgi:integrase
MSSISKRGGTYTARWYRADGTQQWKGGFPTRKAAEAWLRTADPRRDHKAADVLFGDVARAWLASRADLKPTTAEMYGQVLNAPAAHGIMATFGAWPVGAITRQQIQAWADALTAMGKAPSTVRNTYALVRMALAQAVADNRIPTNPADYVRLPSERGNPGVVDDPAQFLTPSQVQALAAATPQPYDVLVYLAAWSGLRAAELAGLTLADLHLPAMGTARLTVARTVRSVGGVPTVLPPKTRGSRRTVPLTAATADLLRAYLAAHPHAGNPDAAVFPAVRLTPPTQANKQAALAAPLSPERALSAAERQTAALAALTPEEHAERLVLDYSAPLRWATFYKAVYRPSVIRATGVAPATTFHALRHTYASLCVAAGLPLLEVSRFMGHSKPTTTLGIYTHLFANDDHAGSMDRLGALGAPQAGGAYGTGGYVVPLRGAG